MRETLIMATHLSPDTVEYESEPLIVETGVHVVKLRLDDGSELIVDRAELEAAVTAEKAGQVRRVA